MNEAYEDDRFEYDDVARDLVPESGKAPDVKMLVGVLGVSDRDGYCRLYFSIEMRDYLEIRADDVLLTRSLKTPENPIGGTAVWIRADADLEVARRTADDAEQEFLNGRITARFLAGATPSGVSAGRRIAIGGLKSVPPVQSCIPALCLPGPPPPPQPGDTAVCTLSARCSELL
jgi:hypothetical protein